MYMANKIKSPTWVSPCELNQQIQLCSILCHTVSKLCCQILTKNKLQGWKQLWQVEVLTILLVLHLRSNPLFPPAQGSWKITELSDFSVLERWCEGGVSLGIVRCGITAVTQFWLPQITAYRTLIPLFPRGPRKNLQLLVSEKEPTLSHLLGKRLKPREHRTKGHSVRGLK